MKKDAGEYHETAAELHYQRYEKQLEDINNITRGKAEFREMTGFYVQNDTPCLKSISQVDCGA